MNDRDLFAAAALTGILAKGVATSPTSASFEAYKCADEMVKIQQTYKQAKEMGNANLQSKNPSN